MVIEVVDSENRKRVFQINSDPDQIPEAVARIREAYGIAYSTFSKRPMSLCRSLERRGELRVKFQEPMYLWPVKYQDGEAVLVRDQPIVSVTRDISPHGVGFCYDEAIETDHVLAEFDLFGKGRQFLLLEIRWMDHQSPYSYVGGGLIVGIVPEIQPQAV